MKCSQGKNIHWISFTTEKSVAFCFPIPHRGIVFTTHNTHTGYIKNFYRITCRHMVTYITALPSGENKMVIKNNYPIINVTDNSFTISTKCAPGMYVSSVCPKI